MSRDPNELGALWLKTSAGGKKYMSGTIKDIGPVVVFKNDKGDNEKAPDYRIFKSKPRDERPSQKPTDDGWE